MKATTRRAVILAWLAVLGPLTLGGCFLMPSSQRPAPGAFSGPAVAVERCETCHAERQATYAESLHAAKGIRCGQCHAATKDHPEVVEPVRDATCGRCHQAELQQTIASTHFAKRVSQALDSDRAARAALRRDHFTAAAPSGRRFVGDSASGEAGGRLCAACHYDEHRLGLRAVQRAEFCVSCHGSRTEHYAGEGSGNRCMTCHVRVGETLNGQVVNTHRFTLPGG